MFASLYKNNNFNVIIKYEYGRSEQTRSRQKFDGPYSKDDLKFPWCHHECTVVPVGHCTRFCKPINFFFVKQHTAIKQI